MLPDLAQVGRCVRDAAREEIVPRFKQVGFSFKSDGSVVTEADLACNQRLQTDLATRYPYIHFLSEEMEPAQQEHVLHTSEWLWILDPLDGTSNFTAGMPIFCTSLALIHNGIVVQAVTYDPLRDELFSAELGQGAYLNGQRLTSKVSGLSFNHSVALVDFKRLPAPLRLELMQKPPYGSQRNLGSSALEWAWMAAGRGQVYLHGGMKLWDLAAGTLLLQEAGGHACTLQGESVFNQSTKVRSVVAASEAALFEQWRDWIHTHSTESAHV